MADREENVYLAKLAEQAERYDGELTMRLAVAMGVYWRLASRWELRGEGISRVWSTIT